MMNYDYWRQALAGEKPKMYVDDPQIGFYRSGVYHKEPNKARKRVGWNAVAIFPNGGEIIANVGGRIEDNRDRINELWSYCAGNPISEETFRAVVERGEPWPDDHATVPSIPMANSSNMEASFTVVAIPEVKPSPLHKRIAAAIDDEIKHIGQFATIDSDEMSSKARSMQQRFLDLRGDAKRAYEEANRPLLDEQKALRDIWFPIRDSADEAANKLRTAMEGWEDFKREQARKAAQAAEAAERARLAEVQKAKEEGKPPPPPVVHAVPNAPLPASQIKGGAGRAASVTLQKFITVTDQDAVYGQFKKAPEIAELLASMALKAVRAGIEVKGVTVEEKSVVR